MFQSLRNWLYDLITASGILLHLLPFYFAIFGVKKFFNPENDSHTITDEGGARVQVLQHKGKRYPRFIRSNFENMKNLNIRKDDLFLCGYPKTGCHWVYEILKIMTTGKVNLSKLGKGAGGMIDFLPGIVVDSIPSQRILNSHVHYEELPEQIKARKTKIIVTVRNPKDTVVSYFNHVKAMSELYSYEGSFENFFKIFMTGEFEYGCYFDAILHWEKIMKSQNDNPVFIIEYEKLKQNPKEILKGVAKFLQISVTDEFLDQVIETTSISNMKAKQSRNKLLRKDQIKARSTKIVVTVRSPKDTAVSYYNHQKNVDFYPGTFEDFFKLFMKGEVEYGYYFDNILHWEKARNNQNDNPILIVAYEKLKRNPLETIKEIASFLDISITEEFAHRVVEVTSFSNMKTKQPKQKQIRKGQVGDWRNWLTEAQSKQIDQVWKDRMSNCDYQPDLS